MKQSHTLTVTFFAGLICSAAADTLHLKNGTTYEGRILRESPDSFVMEVMVTHSIKEEKTVAKSDVANVDRDQPDEKAFVEISKLTPAPDLLTAGDYQSRLASCYKFVKDFPTSSLAAKARAITGELEKELDFISQGGVKLSGRVVSATERQSNKVEIEAQILDTSVRAHARAGEWISALRDFTKLETDYSTTSEFKDVLPLVKQVIQQYHTQLVESSAGLEKRLNDRKVGLERMPVEDRNASARAIAEEDAANVQRLAAEKAAGVKWITPDPYNKATLDESTQYADQEMKRLEALKFDLKSDAGRAWRAAWTAVHGSDAASATTALSDARAAKVPAALVMELESLAKKSGLMK